MLCPLPRSLWLTAALAVALVAPGCASSRPHALDYVVLPIHENGAVDARPAEVLKHEAELDGEDRYPIYAENGDHGPQLGPGTGGAGCSVGLIGAQCERGLLEDEAPLEERQFLGPDGKVIEDEEE